MPTDEEILRLWSDRKVLYLNNRDEVFRALNVLSTINVLRLDIRIEGKKFKITPKGASKDESEK